MARAALSADAVVDVALRLVDEEGPAALTLAAVASRAGVATPSLYKHVRNLAELRALMSVHIMDELAERIGGAVLGRSADEAIRALMMAWRDYVLGHPHRYSALDQAPTPMVAQAGAEAGRHPAGRPARVRTGELRSHPRGPLPARGRSRIRGAGSGERVPATREAGRDLRPADPHGGRRAADAASPRVKRAHRGVHWRTETSQPCGASFAGDEVVLV